MECTSVVNQNVCIETKVTVDPEAEVGDVRACCMGEPKFEKCEKRGGCTYMVSQMLCVQFPLTISATASAKPAGIVCCKPIVEPCCHEEEQCTKEMPSKEGLQYSKSIPVPEHPSKTSSLKEREFVNEAYSLPKTQFTRRKPVSRQCGFCFPPIFFLPFIYRMVNSRNRKISN